MSAASAPKPGLWTDTGMPPNLPHLLIRLRRIWSGSIQRQLTLGISVLLAAIMTVFVYDMVSRQDDFLRWQNQEEARALARTLAANSVSWVLASDLAGLQELIQTVRHYPELRYAMVLDGNGRVLAHTDANHVGRYANDAISRSLATTRMPRILIDSPSLIDIAVPVQEDGTHLGWARVSLGRDSVNTSLREITRYGAVYAAVAIGLGMLLVVLMVRGLTYDLARLVRAARRIGAGERGVQSGLSRADELGELSAAFDAMATDLDGASQELRHSEATLKEAQRIAHVGNWELDLESNRLSWTEEAYRIFGIDPAAFGASYEAFLDAVHPDDRAFVDKAYTDSVKNRTPYDTVHRLLMKDGRVKFVNERCETFYDAAGRPLRSIGTTQDITERKRAENALLESNEMLRSLVENAPIRVFWKDHELRYLGCNTAFARDAGLERPEELIGKDDFQMAWHEQAELYRVDDQQVMNTGMPKLGIEEPQTTPDGRTIWLRTSKVPLRDTAGKVIGLLGIYEDITEHKQAQSALERSERHFRKLIEGGAEAFFVIDQSGTVIYRSPTGVRLTGWRDEEVMGKNIANYVLPEYVEGVRTTIAETIRNPEKSTYMELRLRRKDGTTLDVEAIGRNLLADPDVGGIVVTVRDITERKRAEQAAQERMHRIEAQAQALGTVSASEAMATGDVEQLARKITEHVCRAVGVERANVWLFNDAETELRCIDLFEATPARHSAGAVLRQSEFESEFRALKDARYVDAHEPLTDPRTLGYVESYLKPLRITSMLDAVVQLPDRHLGLLCLEHVDRSHHWEHDEIAFACQLADKIALAITNRGRREAQLAELEQFKLAETFFNHSVGGLVILDRNFNFIRVNETYARLCRKDIGEFAGRNHFEMYPSDAQPIFEDVVRTKQPYMAYARAFTYPDQPGRGATYWDWTLVPILDSTGEVEYLVYSLQEVTERQRAEEKQRAAALYARSLIEASLDPLITISSQGKIMDVNRMTEEVTGVGRTALIGTDFTDYFTEPEQARAGYRQVLAEGYIRDYPLTIRHRSGRTTDVLYNATVYRNESGELQGVFAAARDITERKQAETVRIQLAAIVQSSNDAIIGKSPDGIITSWNPGAEKVYGYRAEEVIGQPVSALAPEGRKDEIMQLLGVVSRGETVADFETVRFRKDGRRIDMALTLSPIRDADGRITGISTIARDITEKKQAERALHKVNRALKALSHGNTALIHARDEDQLLSEMCRVIVEIAGYRMAWVGYVEHDAEQTIRLVAQSGYAPDFTVQSGITWADNECGQGPLGIAVRTGQLQVVQDVMTDARFEPWRANAARLGYGSVLVAPLIPGKQVIGALSINAEGAHAFDDAEIALLSELAADMAYGIATLRARTANEQNAERLQRGMEATIGAIAATVEMRDPYTAGHQRRVAELAVAIAREMGLTEDRVHGLHLAGVVHDLGKVHIPAEILSKPARLSRIEFELIKTHPEAGYDILRGIDFPWPIAQVVLQHHERLDGSGYPRGIKGDEILLETRILTVADVVEAMASHRPYRPSLGIDAALDEIAANAGKYYDPEVARICIALFREKGFTFTGSTSVT